MSAPIVEVASGSSGSASSSDKKDKKNRFIRIFDNPDQLTPYQGTRRAFGHFHCLHCDVEWASANTWANKGQDCLTCLNNTYPYRQTKLLKGGKRDKDKPHPQAHCEMCKELKEVCKNKFMIDQKKKGEKKAGESSGKQSGDEKKAEKNRRRRSRKNGTNKAVTTPNEE